MELLFPTCPNIPFELYDAVISSDLQKVAKWKHAPCCIITHAKNMAMWNLLLSKGSTYLVEDRCKLTKVLLITRGNISSVPPAKKLQLDLDSAISHGDIRSIYYLLAQNATSSLTNEHWKDFVVQDFFTNALHPIWCEMLSQKLQFFPMVIIEIITDYLQTWDTFKSKIQAGYCKMIWNVVRRQVTRVFKS